MIFKAGESAGRSGSFFFFSHDGKFVVKTINSSELRLIKKITPLYAKHLENNPDSLLSKVLGVFTVEADKFSKVHIMLMENTVRLKEPSQLRYIFDLKGSTVNRFVEGPTAPSKTLKDVNFMLIKKKMINLTRLSRNTCRKLVNAMRNDVSFLSSLNLMDYSMLIAIEKAHKQTAALHHDQVSLLPSFESTKKDVGEWMSERHRFQYEHKILHISIIDYLQEWNVSKQSERLYKTIVLRKDQEQISAVEPN